MARIFISYRRDDHVSVGIATGRLYDYLCQNFGEDRVFWDVDSIQGGDDFREKIYAELEDCMVILVMIGNKWLDILNERDTDDVLRLEISTALKRKNITVIPVLVGSTTSMPKNEELPSDLKSLAGRHYKTLSNANFKREAQDIQELLIRNKLVGLPLTEIGETILVEERQFYSLFVEAVQRAKSRVYLTNLGAPPMRDEDTRERLQHFDNIDRIIKETSNISFRRLHGLPTKKRSGRRDRCTCLRWLGEQMALHEDQSDMEIRAFDFEQFDLDMLDKGRSRSEPPFMPLLSLQIIDDQRLLMIDVGYGHHGTGRRTDIWFRGTDIVKQFERYYEGFWSVCQRFKTTQKCDWALYKEYARDCWGDDYRDDLPPSVTDRL